MESPMHRRQPVVPDLQAPGLADPGERARHHPADFAQAAAVRRPRPRPVIRDPPLLEAPLIARPALRAIPVQRLGLPPRPAAPPAEGRAVVHPVHRLERLRAVRSGEAQGQRGALAIDEPVPLGAFFGPIRGVLPVRAPPKRPGSSGCPRRRAARRYPSPGRPAAGGHAGASCTRPGAARTAAAASRSRRSRNPSLGGASPKGCRGAGRRPSPSGRPGPRPGGGPAGRAGPCAEAGAARWLPQARPAQAARP